MNKLTTFILLTIFTVAGISLGIYFLKGPVVFKFSGAILIVISASFWIKSFKIFKKSKS
jgi:hypothetical protein